MSSGGHLCLHPGLALRQNLIQSLGIRKITGHYDLTHQIDCFRKAVIKYLRLQFQSQYKLIRILQLAIDIIYRSHAAGDQIHLVKQISISIMLRI